ncbi:hypothetical protein NFX46_19435 [Streptomyces phaeoluteigriseus]|uniref:Bacterial bifunctional deaminase-reductase C-terminal domain-containing protein n=1 Tax=Streptomyces phaeoluteigriseus TaxID=114686 RepID=A0ABY4ZAN3_9ACTN|nr:hypothetical protein [Streptomyces phaeoluteigriseus]USQ85740.1 hypothetical protein NFX46_19435 [Streptomyces phaeoluteigriseus]
MYVLPVLLGGGVRFAPPGLDRIVLERFSNVQSGGVTMLPSTCASRHGRNY